MPKFSVIVPVYNAANTIERCVESLIACGEDMQIILIEDCSRDNSWEKCCALADKYPSVTALHNEQNRGVSYTRNRGLDAAKGEYLLFTDSDDWVDPDYATAFRRVTESNPKLAICGFINHDEKQNGRTDVFSWTDFEKEKTVCVKDEIEELYRSCLLQQLWNKVFVTAIVREHNIQFDESISIGEDTRFILNYIRKGGVKEITLINRPLYHYMRDQEGSLMFSIGTESVEEPLKNLRLLYEIMGLDKETAEQRLTSDRQKQIELYAYLIMHNMGMKMCEKHHRILTLSPSHGEILFLRNFKILMAEKVSKVLDKFRRGSY